MYCAIKNAKEGYYEHFLGDMSNIKAQAKFLPAAMKTKQDIAFLFSWPPLCVPIT